MFGALVFYMGNDNGRTLPVSQMTIGSTIFPFWAVGVAVVLLSLVIFFYLSYLLNTLITSRKIKRLNEIRRIEIAEGKARESELKIQIELI